MALFADGYAMASIDGRTCKVHRVAYGMTKGAVPEGMHLDHTCHTLAFARGECAGGRDCPHRRCINPDHLEPVTPRQNVTFGANVCGENARKTHCHRGHEFTPENTKVTRQGWRSCRACCRIREAGYRATEKA